MSDYDDIPIRIGFFIVCLIAAIMAITVGSRLRAIESRVTALEHTVKEPTKQ